MADTRCIHGLDPVTCDHCRRGLAIRRAGHPASTADEPAAHRGHPDASEVDRAAGLRPLLIEALGTLAAADIERPLAFFAELARMVAHQEGLESWGPDGSPRKTIQGILDGGAAKHWSMNVLESTIQAVYDLTKED